MRSRLFTFGPLLLSILFTSPAFAEKRHNLSVADLLEKPAISTFRDPDTDFSRYKTFSVFPFSLLSDKLPSNEIMEKQFLFALRNSLELRGYRFVPLGDHPDLIATMDASAEYKESIVPAQTLLVPRYVPGRTLTTTSSTTGSLNLTTLGTYGSEYSWGSYSGLTTSTTYIPGYSTLQTVTRPGYTVGAYYPAVSISIFDGKTLKNVWFGSGAGSSHTSDPRISSQVVITYLMGEFPTIPAARQPLPGVRIGVFTNDGNAYVPVVLDVPNGPAKKAGLKQYDMILGIDGRSLINKPFSEALAVLRGEPGTRSILDVLRLDKRLSLNVTRSGVLAATSVALGDLQNRGLLYFYRNKSGFDSVANPTVRCDGIDLARLEKGQFFTFAVPPGEHRCRLTGSTSSAEEMSIVVEPGQAYIVKYEGALSKHLTVVDHETALKDWKKLKPIEVGAIKHPQVTSIPLPK